MDRPKVVGATGFEPATPCAQERGLAISRDVMRKDDRSQVLWSQRFNAYHRKTSRHQIAHRNPAGTPQKSHFLAVTRPWPPVSSSNRHGTRWRRPAKTGPDRSSWTEDRSARWLRVIGDGKVKTGAISGCRNERWGREQRVQAWL